jgi:hypothetical protein
LSCDARITGAHLPSRPEGQRADAPAVNGGTAAAAPRIPPAWAGSARALAMASPGCCCCCCCWRHTAAARFRGLALATGSGSGKRGWRVGASEGSSHSAAEKLALAAEKARASPRDDELMGICQGIATKAASGVSR